MRRSEVETEWGAYGDTEGAIEVEYGAYEEISAILPCEVNRGNLKVIGEWLPPNPPFLRNGTYPHTGTPHQRNPLSLLLRLYYSHATRSSDHQRFGAR